MSATESATADGCDEPQRYIGLDVSKLSVMVAAVNSKQQTVLTPRKVSLEKFENWAKQSLSRTDSVVLEATGNAWPFYDMLVPLVAQVTVANPNKLKLITQTKVKTDAKDALLLAKLLAAAMIEPVWVPPHSVRDLRALVAHRERLISQRTRARNRLHSILQAHHLFPPPGDPFANKNIGWWDKLEVSMAHKLLIKQEIAVLNSLQLLVNEVEQHLVQCSTKSLWKTEATLLIQLPGIGVLNAMVILAAIGDITRFECAKKLVGYSGMGASVYASGQVYRTGGITRQGRPQLRTTLVEAAWSAVAKPGHWQELFKRLASRLGQSKAIMAIARKLLVAVWHILTKQVADQRGEEVRVAQKLLNWAYKLRKVGRGGLGGTAFVREQLEVLKLGYALREVKWGGKVLALPPSPALLDLAGFDKIPKTSG